MKHKNPLLGVCFRDIDWLSSSPLTQDTALEYFSLSQFYDKTCNNEVLKMQSEKKLSHGEITERLPKMLGVEYAVETKTRSLFLVTKQERKQAEISPLEIYYILDGTVYMSPSLCDLTLARVDSALHFLEKALASGNEGGEK
ncbi:MAG: Mediator of RNA polymerase II transcription subunit 6 [Amphiamblys sp. WSBS2006]|nr:MAG: Mediator of RNA polymerase II transcription subunit 6 [Amphiamblys sp. WSBS2006]